MGVRHRQVHNYLRGPVGSEERAHLPVELLPLQVRGGHGEVVQNNKVLGLLLDRPKIVTALVVRSRVLQTALEMNVFNPETSLRDMELDDIEALKVLLNQQHREVERVTREQGRGMPSTGAFGPEEHTPEAILGVPAGSVEFSSA